MSLWSNSSLATTGSMWYFDIWKNQQIYRKENAQTSQAVDKFQLSESLVAAMQEAWVRSLGGEDPLEKGMATHSSTLAWEIPWTGETSGLRSMGLPRVGWSEMKVAQSCPTLCDPMDCCSLGQNTGVGSLSIIPGMFQTRESNPGLLQCIWILYQLNHQGSPRVGHDWATNVAVVNPLTQISQVQKTLLLHTPKPEIRRWQMHKGTPARERCQEYRDSVRREEWREDVHNTAQAPGQSPRLIVRMKFTKTKGKKEALLYRLSTTYIYSQRPPFGSVCSWLAARPPLHRHKATEPPTGIDPRGLSDSRHSPTLSWHHTVVQGLAGSWRAHSPSLSWPLCSHPPLFWILRWDFPGFSPLFLLIPSVFHLQISLLLLLTLPRSPGLRSQPGFPTLHSLPDLPGLLASLLPHETHNTQMCITRPFSRTPDPCFQTPFRYLSWMFQHIGSPCLKLNSSSSPPNLSFLHQEQHHQLCLLHQKTGRWDFPGSSVVETLSFHCWGHEFNPW